MINVLLVVLLIAIGSVYFYTRPEPGSVDSIVAIDEQNPQCYIDLYDKASAGDMAALAELRKHAEKGVTSAQNNLALIYSQGHAVAQDYAEAFKWYRKAAEQGLRMPWA